jgi:hypothetical protein
MKFSSANSSQVSKSRSVRIGLFFCTFSFCVSAGANTIGGPAFAQEHQATDDALSARSVVVGIEFITIGRLPHAPASAKSQKDCDWMLAKPKTPGGRLAASLGWGVTAEVQLGAYEALSFASQFEPYRKGCAFGTATP